MIYVEITLTHDMVVNDDELNKAYCLPCMQYGPLPWNIRSWDASTVLRIRYCFNSFILAEESKYPCVKYYKILCSTS